VAPPCSPVLNVTARIHKGVERSPTPGIATSAWHPAGWLPRPETVAWGWCERGTGAGGCPARRGGVTLVACVGLLRMPAYGWVTPTWRPTRLFGRGSPLGRGLSQIPRSAQTDRLASMRVRICHRERGAPIQLSSPRSAKGQAKHACVPSMASSESFPTHSYHRRRISKVVPASRPPCLTPSGRKALQLSLIATLS